MSDLTSGLRELRVLISSSGSLRAALCAWDPGAQSVRVVVQRVANLSRLGASLPAALEPLRSLSHGDLVVRSLMASAGLDPGAALDRLIVSLEEAERLGHEHRSAALPSKLSARLLAVIGAVVVATTFVVGTRPALVPSLCAAGLCGAGAWWTARLRARSHLPGTLASDVDALGALIGAGVPLGEAVEVVGGCQMTRPTRLVRLGASWGRAFEDEVHGLGDLLDQMTGTGNVGAQDLHALAERMRETHRRASELGVKRMPVMLVLPLSLCFLPAFALVIAEPLLRAVTP